MAGQTVEVTIPDLSKWKKKLTDRPMITTRGVKAAMQKAATESAVIYKRGTPKLTGKLRSSVRGEAMVTRAKVLFDPIASKGKGKGASFRSGYALNSSRFSSTKGYRDRIKDQIAAGPARRAAAEIGKEIERLWQA